MINCATGALSLATCCLSLPLRGPSHWAAVGSSCLSAANTAPSWVIYPTHWPSPWAARERSRMRTLALFVVLCVLGVCLCCCVQPAMHMCVCHMGVCVHILGTHAQPHYWQDLGAWSCSSLHAVKLPQKATKKLSWVYSTWEVLNNNCNSALESSSSDFSCWVSQQNTGENTLLGEP